MYDDGRELQDQVEELLLQSVAGLHQTCRRHATTAMRRRGCGASGASLGCLAPRRSLGMGCQPEAWRRWCSARQWPTNSSGAPPSKVYPLDTPMHQASLTSGDGTPRRPAGACIGVHTALRPLDAPPVRPCTPRLHRNTRRVQAPFQSARLIPKWSARQPSSFCRRYARISPSRGTSNAPDSQLASSSSASRVAPRRAARSIPHRVPRPRLGEVAVVAAGCARRWQALRIFSLDNPCEGGMVAALFGGIASCSTPFLTGPVSRKLASTFRVAVRLIVPPPPPPPMAR